MAEVLWALLLFPSNLLPATKRDQIRTVWTVTSSQLDSDNALLADAVLKGIGSGGPAFQQYRPDELEYLLQLALALKQLPQSKRSQVFALAAGT